MIGISITDIRVRPYIRRDERLKAFATITLNGCFVVTDVKVIDGPRGLFVAMPSRKRRDGTFRDIAHPANQECRDEIENTVLKAYREAEKQGFPGTDAATHDGDDAEPFPAAQSA